VTLIAITSVCNIQLGVRENFMTPNTSDTTYAPQQQRRQIVIRNFPAVTLFASRVNGQTSGNLVEASSYATPRNILTPKKDIGHHQHDTDSTSALLNTEQEETDVISRHPLSTQGRAGH